MKGLEELGTYLIPSRTETIAPDPSSVERKYTNSSISKDKRQNAFARSNFSTAFSLQYTVLPIVRNFQTKLGLRRNDPSDLERIGIRYDPKHDGGEGTNGSQENAFRHALGQALATAWYGRARATEAGFAHEDHPESDTSQRVFTDKDNPIAALHQADTVADLLNNEIGRRIAERTPTEDAKKLVVATLGEFYEKGLYTAEFLGPGLVRVRREAVGLEQFSRSMELIDKLDSGGLTQEEEEERERKLREKLRQPRRF